MIVGYQRVSSLTQNTDRQLTADALPLGVTVEHTFTDHCSGKDTDREQLTAMLGFVRQGDTIIVHSMDRLARNLDDLRRLVATLTARGVAVTFVKESLTFTGDDSPMSKLLLSMLGAVAEFERDMIRERQREGIALAKSKGVYKGRKPALSPEQAVALRQRASEGIGVGVLAEDYGCSRQTVYNCLRQP